MITEKQILDLGFVKQSYSTDIEGVYEYQIPRTDICNNPYFYTSHIYRIFWDYDTDFIIRGSYERPNKEGVKTRMTKTINKTFTDISQLEENLEVIIKSDMNRFTSTMRKY